MYEYEMDPTWIVGATEQTRDAGRTDRQTDRQKDGLSETNIPPTTSLCGGIIMISKLCSIHLRVISHVRLTATSPRSQWVYTWNPTIWVPTGHQGISQKYQTHKSNVWYFLPWNSYFFCKKHQNSVLGDKGLITMYSWYIVSTHWPYTVMKKMSTWLQVLACCQMAPKHYLTQIMANSGARCMAITWGPSQ